jgi:hypothetical protein
VGGDQARLTQMDPLTRITQHLDKTDDPTLLILRTHLMVEKRLRDILPRICRAPDELQAARLSFHQVLCICRAVVGRNDDPAWGFVQRLNEVRNRMAHHLDPGNLDELLGSAVDKLGKGASSPVAYACRSIPSRRCVRVRVLRCDQRKRPTTRGIRS